MASEGQNHRLEKRAALISLTISTGKAAWEADLLDEADESFNRALGWVDEPIWDWYPDLALETCIEAGKFRESTAKNDRLLEICTILREHIKTPTQRLLAGALEIRAYTALGEMSSAVETGLEILRELQLARPGNGMPPQSVAGLADLPSLIDSFDLATLQCLRALVPALYLARPDLLPEIVFWQIDLCLQGNSVHAIDSYSIYSILLVASGKIEAGYQFGGLALTLLDRYNDKLLQTIAYNAYSGYVQHWHEPLSHSLELLQTTIREGLEAGSLEHVCYAAANRCAALAAAGIELGTAAEEIEGHIAIIERCGRQHTAEYGRVWLQLICCLRGGGEIEFDLEIHEGNGTAIFAYYCAQLQLAYFQQQPEQAIHYAEQAVPYLQSVAGLICVPLCNFYYSLALLERYSDAEAQEQAKILNQVTANQRQMAIWYHHAPMNFQHKYELVEAEKARVKGKCDRALCFYDRAMENAKRHGYLQEEALISERLAAFYLESQQEEVAQLYFSVARARYSQWGAVAKVEDLEQRYPWLTRAESPESTSRALMDFFLSKQQRPLRLLLGMHSSARYDDMIRVMVFTYADDRLAKLIRAKAKQLQRLSELRIKIVSPNLNYFL